jgi:hypothetical protein
VVGVTIAAHFAKNVLTVEKLTGQMRGIYERLLEKGESMLPERMREV